MKAINGLGTRLGVMVAAGTLAAGAAIYAQFPSFPEPPQPTTGGFGSPATAIQSPDLIFPTVQIVQFDKTVARFDATTGELWRFQGTLTGASAGGTWARLARPVTEPTSGFLQFSQVGNATFMTDVVTGDTWILRRTNSTASWFRVPVR